MSFPETKEEYSTRLPAHEFERTPVH